MSYVNPEEVRNALIKSRFSEHLIEAKTMFPERQIVVLALQGSQNYRLEVPNSDIDTKLIVTPSFDDIARNRKPVSTTHIRANEEHIDNKDIRLYIETFRKQNLNFLEILFTDFMWVNPLYADFWNKLIAAREDIARMNPCRAVRSMVGIAREKYHAMEHPYPSKVEILAKMGYDPKQVHHLLRVEKYLNDYLAGKPYKECLIPEGKDREFMMDMKLGKYSLEEAREIAAAAMARIEAIYAATYKDATEKEDSRIRELLEEVQVEIMKTSIKEELYE